MIDIQHRHVTSNCQELCRRDFLRVGTVSMLGLTLADWFALKATGSLGEARARSVIQIWLGGGPSHLDTFDPKPEAGQDYCGPLRKPIDTNADGIRIGELFPKLARQADKFSLLRSMTHGSNAHETATYIMMTGTMPSEDLCYPSVGAVVALKQAEAGRHGLLPPYITLTKPLGRFSEAGFLGANHRTFAPGGNPNASAFRVQGLVPPQGLTETRMDQRRSLLAAVDRFARDREASGALADLDQHQARAYGLILGDAKKAFDLSAEPPELRDQYGRTPFGQSCLLARRLVENDVPFITVNMGGWDTHKDNFGRMKQLCPDLDQGYAALLEDLAQRGLLESTVVVCYGEFGRTPKVQTEAPWFGGRNHFSSVFTAVVSGGGFRAGSVVGASDARGETVKDRPIYPWDLSASIYQLLGIDPRGTLPHPQGCTARVTPLGSDDVPTGGLLHEIM